MSYNLTIFGKTDLRKREKEEIVKQCGTNCKNGFRVTMNKNEFACTCDAEL